MHLNRRSQSYTWWLVVTILLCGRSAYSDPATFLVVPTHYVPPKEMTWYSAPWTDPDEPYEQVEHKVAQETASHLDIRLDIRKVIALEKDRWAKTPTDPLAVYGWAYANWQYQNRGAEPNLNIQDPSPQSPLEDYPQPNSYKYVRMIYLYQAGTRQTDETLNAGFRLLDRDPNDLDVLQLQSDGLTLGGREDCLTALSLAHRLYHLQPRAPRSTRALANAFGTLYYLDRQKKYQTQAIIWYKKYLHSGALTQDGRALVEEAMDDVRLNRF